MGNLLIDCRDQKAYHLFLFRNDDEDGHEIDDRNFIVSKKDGAVQVYTDGACNKNGTGEDDECACINQSIVHQ